MYVYIYMYVKRTPPRGMFNLNPPKRQFREKKGKRRRRTPKEP